MGETKTKQTLQSVDYIPVDIVVEIFMRLPARSVGRFVCLSKLYASIICSKGFIRSYSLLSSTRKQQPRLLLAFNKETEARQESWFFFSKPTLVISTPLRPCMPAPGPPAPVLPSRFGALWRARVSRRRNCNLRRDGGISLKLKAPTVEEEQPKALITEEEEEEEPKALEPPPDFAPDFVSSTVCSHLKKLRHQNPSYVHGLISLLYGQEQVIINPSTGKSTTLPTVAASSERTIIVRSFLGYDPIAAQHKVLCLTNVIEFCDHQVLTLGGGAQNWRMIQCNIPHYPAAGYSSVCVDGVLYYRASTSFNMKQPFLVGFDLRSEILDIASVFPQGLDSSNDDTPTLVNYHGKVALVTYHHRNGHHFNLWVLDKKEWSKECISFHTGVTGKFHGDLQILGASDMGEIIFAPINFKELVIYFLDHKSNRIRSIELEGNTKYKFRDFNYVFTFLHYVESAMFL